MRSPTTGQLYSTFGMWFADDLNLIENITSSNVRVRMTCRVVWSDGSVQQLSGIADPGTLAPGGGYIQSIYFIIPPDAPPGPASFIADATASAIEPSSGAPCFVVFWSALNTGFGNRCRCTSSRSAGC